MKEKLKQNPANVPSAGQAGITLIALIITIIVLLILAVVSIRLVVNNGILGKAEYAVDKYSEEERTEQVKLLQAEYEMAKYEGKVTGTCEEYVLDKMYGMKIGDYVNYTYDEASDYTLTKNESGYTGDQTIPQTPAYSSTNTNGLRWRVMGINDKGQIELISDKPTSARVYFGNAAGYNNGVFLLNDICKTQYSNEKLGIEARSLTIEDIEKQYTSNGIKARADYKNSESGKKYGETEEYTSSKKYPIIFAEEVSSGKKDGIGKSDPKYTSRDQLVSGFQADGTTVNTATYGEKGTDENLTATQAYGWSNTPSSYIQNTNFYNMIFGTKTHYWLASRFIDCRSFWADFCLRGVYDAGLLGEALCNSRAYTNNPNNSIRPVVSLPSDIQLSGSSESGWTIQ